ILARIRGMAINLSDPYLPGAISLFEQLDKHLIVVLRDGRKLIGYLRSIDQFANLVLDEVVERTYIQKYYSEISHGILLIRGENVVLAGELDDTIETGQIKVSIDELNRIEASLEHTNNDVQGGTSSKNDLPLDEPY
ncbi:lsm-1, partial [Pristionchus pacificus]